MNELTEAEKHWNSLNPIGECGVMSKVQAMQFIHRKTFEFQQSRIDELETLLRKTIEAGDSFYQDEDSSIWSMFRMENEETLKKYKEGGE